MTKRSIEFKSHSERRKMIKMNEAHPKLSIRLFAVGGIAILFALLTACGGVEQPSPVLEPGSGSKSTPDPKAEQGQSGDQQRTKTDGLEVDPDGFALTEQIATALQQIEQKPDILSAAFKVAGFRVSLVDSTQGSYPIITFSPVEGADFYQVLRCTGAAVLTAESMNLEQVIAGAKDLSSEIAQQIKTPFWENLSANPGCSILHERLTRTAFIDQLRDLPSVKYIARACTVAFKAADPGAVSCSPILSVSNLVTLLSTRTGKVVDKVQEEIAKLKSNIENASVDLTKKTKEFAAAVVECEKTNRKQNLANHRKQLLLAILSVGAKIGGELLNATSPNPIEAFKSIWKDKKQLVADTRPILDVFKDVFVTEKNNILTCAKSEFKATEAGILLSDINAKTAALAKLTNSVKTAVQEVTK